MTARTVRRLVPRAPPSTRAFVERRVFGCVVEDVAIEGVTDEKTGTTTPARARLQTGVGARIARFLEGSGLPTSGLETGDVILSIDDEPVHGGEDFLALARTLGPAQDIRVQVRRGGKVHRLSLTTRNPGRHVSEAWFPLLFDYANDPAADANHFGLLPFNLFLYERKENGAHVAAVLAHQIPHGLERTARGRRVMRARFALAVALGLVALSLFTPGVEVFAEELFVPGEISSVLARDMNGGRHARPLDLVPRSGRRRPRTFARAFHGRCGRSLCALARSNGSRRRTGGDVHGR